MRRLLACAAIVASVLAFGVAGRGLADPPPDPTANDDAYTTGVDADLTVAAPGVLGNDVSTDPLSVDTHLTSDPLHGELDLQADGGFTYSPDDGYHGVDQFTYVATSGPRKSKPATVTVTVDGAPVATDDPGYVGHAGQALTVGPAQGLLANDSDPDGDPLSAVVPQETGPSNGLLALGADGSFLYTPDPGFVGVDTFTYRASDGLLNSPSATASITVVNDAPVPANNVYFLRQNGSLSVDDPDAGVLGNDSDPNGDPMTAILAEDVTSGVLDLHTDGTFDYTPNPGFVGKDLFKYRASDGKLLSHVAAVALTVRLDSAPRARDDTFGPVAAAQQLDVGSPGVLGNDTDRDPGDQQILQAQLATEPGFGDVQLEPDGSFSYTPDPGACNRIDRFTYTATDGILPSSPADVTVSIDTARRPTALSLQASRARVVYGRSVSLRAHLSEFSPSAVIQIFRKSGGGDTVRITRAQPDSNGFVRVDVRPARHTRYWARSSDNCFESETTEARVVDVFPVVDGKMLGSFGRRDGFALYHSGGRAPHYRARVTPAHPGAAVGFVWQRRSGGRWKTYFATRKPLHLENDSTIDVFMTGGVVRDVRYRVRIVFLADGDHLARAAPWSYFMAT